MEDEMAAKVKKKKDNNGLVSMRELSRQLGVTLRTVQQAVHKGRIIIEKTEQAKSKQRHFFNVEKAREQWANNTSAAETQPTRRQKGKGPQTPNTPKKQADATAPATAPAGNPVFSEARTQVELYKSKNAELDYKVKVGELVSMDKAKDCFHSISLMLKQNILNIPARLSSVLAAETSEKNIYDLLSRELKQALKVLSDEQLKLNGNGK